MLPTLVLVHDVSSVPREFDLLAATLEARAVAFDPVEVPGYTAGLGEAAARWRRWLDVAGAVIDRRHAPGAPIALAGIGAGGALAAALALAPRPQRVAGVAMLSPCFDASAARGVGERLGAALGLDRRVQVARVDAADVRNPKTRRSIERDLAAGAVSAIGPALATQRALAERDALASHVVATIATLSVPLLILHAADDADGLARAEAAIAPLGARARVVTLAHSGRHLAADNDRQRVAHELADFIGAPKRVARPVAAVAAVVVTQSA